MVWTQIAKAAQGHNCSINENSKKKKKAHSPELSPSYFTPISNCFVDLMKKKTYNENLAITHHTEKSILLIKI